MTNPIPVLTPEECISGMRRCAANAARLVAEADLMFAARSFSTSAFLCLTAIEELSKSTLLLSASHADGSFNWKSFWRAYRDHQTKSHVGAITAAYELGDTEAVNVAYHGIKREELLYVDRRDGTWTRPSEREHGRNSMELLNQTKSLLESEIKLLEKSDDELINPQLTPLDPENPEHQATLNRARDAITWRDRLLPPRDDRPEEPSNG